LFDQITNPEVRHCGGPAATALAAVDAKRRAPIATRATTKTRAPGAGV
jgi:hypothetical protein